MILPSDAFKKLGDLVRLGMLEEDRPYGGRRVCKSGLTVGGSSGRMNVRS